MSLVRDADFNGIIMYRRDYRERDLLVQILTDKFGPKMFLVQGAKKRGFRMASAILPFTESCFIGRINSNGLSYLTTTKSTKQWRQISTDILAQAYGSYLLSLTAAAFEENQPLGRYFDLVSTAIDRMDHSGDYQLLTNIVELKLLGQFGVAPYLAGCVVCQRNDLPLDYSEKYGGLLCQQHWQLDSHRLHTKPKAIALMQQLNQIMPVHLGQTHIQDQTKQELQRVLDHIYQDQVGLKLRSKDFLDELLRQPNPLIQTIDNLEEKH